MSNKYWKDTFDFKNVRSTDRPLYHQWYDNVCSNYSKYVKMICKISKPNVFSLNGPLKTIMNGKLGRSCLIVGALNRFLWKLLVDDLRHARNAPKEVHHYLDDVLRLPDRKRRGEIRIEMAHVLFVYGALSVSISAFLICIYYASPLAPEAKEIRRHNLIKEKHMLQTRGGVHATNSFEDYSTQQFE